MCGIVGIATAYSNGFSNDEAEAFTAMLYVDTMRGEDSTGVFGVDKYKNVRIHKDAIDGPSFIKTPEYKAYRSSLLSSGVFAVGHNRAATRGSVVEKNAHPFWVDDKIVLVQNGTYKGCHKHHKNVEVDTEAIAHVLADEPDISKALKSINAAYALVWFNPKEGKLNIIRNEERPLWVAYTMSDGFMWASEEATLWYAIKKTGIKMKKDPYMLRDGHLVQLTLDKGNWTSDHKNIDIKYERPPTLVDVVEDDDVYFPRRFKKYFPSMAAYDDWRNTKYGVCDITKDISQVLASSDETLGLSEEESRKIAVEWESTKDAVVELIDFHPANDHPNCKTWLVYGETLHELKEGEKSPIYHWIVYDKSQEEMLDYCTKHLYYGKVYTYVRRSFMNGAGDRVYATTAFVADVTKVPTESALHVQ